MGDLSTLKKDFEQHKAGELNSFLASDQMLEFPNSDNALVSVILVFYNRAELSYACLKSLLENCHIPLEIIIIDNCSTDKTDELVSKLKGVIYIKNTENKNFLLACNQAAELAKGKYLLFLNNDATIRESAIENGIKVFQEEKKVGAVGGKIILLDGKLQEAGSIVWNDGSCLGYGRGHKPDNNEYMYRRDVNFCSGAFLMTPKSLFLKLGKFDEQFVPAYYEETDYCLTLQENGYRVIYEPTCVIDHFEFASSEKQSSAIELQKKNQQKFFKKHEEYIKALPAPDLANILLARQVNNKKKVLFIEDRIPHEDLGAGFPRSNQIVNSLVSLDYEVTIYSLNFLREDSWDKIYRDLDRKVELITDLARAGFDDFVSERSKYYDLIWVSRPHNMEFVYDRLSAFENVKVIYDAEAIFSDRIIEKVKLKGESINEEEVLKEELSLGEYADAVVAVKDRDAELFKEHGHEHTYVLNVAFPQPEVVAPFKSRQDILFVGNMDYNDSPNVDSLSWFIDNVFPILRKEVPGIKLHLVGTNRSTVVRSYAKKDDDIILHGRVDDLTEYYNSCKIFIAPTRYAAGSPAKVFMAAAYGIPVVATELIISQVGWKKGQYIEGCHHDDHDRFASLCLELILDEKKWKRLSTNSLKIVNEQNGVQAYMDKLSRIVAKTLGIKKVKRKKAERLSIENIKSKELKVIYEKFLDYKKENKKLKEQIKEGERYVLKLLEEINAKNREIAVRGELISDYRSNYFIKFGRGFKSITTQIGRPFAPINRGFQFLSKLFGIFLKRPVQTIRYFNLSNIKALYQAINNEPISLVLDNIAKKINMNKDE